MASINLVTSHNGFTLLDLVSYSRKHNEANGDDDWDVYDDNRSWNCGVEGPADDPGVRALRGRQQRNFLATLLLSQGVPVLQAGDELGRARLGNNNAYCQDNEISWVNWEKADKSLQEFACKLTALRRKHPVFHHRQFFGDPGWRGAGGISWFASSGQPITDDDWNVGHAKAVSVFLNRNAITEPGPRGSAWRCFFPAALQPDQGRGVVLDTCPAVRRPMGDRARYRRHSGARRHRASAAGAGGIAFALCLARQVR